MHTPPVLVHIAIGPEAGRTFVTGVRPLIVVRAQMNTQILPCIGAILTVWTAKVSVIRVGYDMCTDGTVRLEGIVANLCSTQT